MMMQSLIGLYNRLESEPVEGEPKVGPEGFTVEKVRWVITLDEVGRIVGVNRFSDSSGSKKGGFRMMAVPAQMGRSSNPEPYFLCDKAAYLLGLPMKKNSEKHSLSKKLHLEVLQGCESPIARSLRAFFIRDEVVGDLSDDDRQALEEDKDQGFIVFRVMHHPGFAHEDPVIAKSWKAYKSRELENGDPKIRQCSVTGSKGHLARLFLPISGIPGAQSSGAMLVSYNCPAFESYGKEQTYNASISQDAAFRAGSALRYLYRSDCNKVRFGDTMVLFWCDGSHKEKEESFFRFAFSGRASDDGELDVLRQYLLDLRAGRSLSQLDLDARFHVLGISPNAARLAVRFYFEDTLAGFTDGFGLYLRDIEMVGCKTTSIYAFIRQAALLGKDDNVPRTVVNACMAAMLKGAPFPRLLFTSVLARMRADHGDKHPWDCGERAATMKGYLVRKARLQHVEIPDERRLTVSLSETNDDIGYVLGRMFALVEYAQRGARGTVGASVVDRYIAAASATPARTFPVLFRGLQNDMSKLRKDKPGMAVFVDKRISSVMDLLDGSKPLPVSLNEDQQGCFFIGFYQQHEELYAKRDSKDDSEETDQIEED